MSAGRKQYTTALDGAVTLATWDNAYPVVYEYDDQNRMVAMATTRNENLRNVCLLNQIPADETLSTWQPAANDKIDITKWQYDSATGLLTDKVYSDGKGPEYVYTSDGKLSQRTWARGVTTDYEYDFAGSLTNIVYGDSTPDVAYTYNRLGQQLSALTYDSTTGAYVTSNYFVYTPTLELDYELQNGAKIDRSTDFLGRNTGFSLLNSAEQAVNAVSYSYDAYGRFSALQATTPGDTDTFTYSYLPDTGLISGYSAATGGTASPLSVFRTYERNRNLITAITNAVGITPAVISSFDYVNDALGRRTQRSDYYHDGNNPVTTDNVFGYNSFSEVTNMLAVAEDNSQNKYAYDYDPIGNRVEGVENDSTTDYQVNSLNQYTSITKDATVSPTYDLDGNILSDGSMEYAWDAENRLVIVTKPRYGGGVKFIYDHQSRRISKSVLSHGVSIQGNAFIYDGWNLIYEVSTDLTTSTISTNLYVWGLDLSGTLQGAGGVGGLLSTTISTPSTASTCLTLSDANGNITEYVNTNGTVAAHYEYDSFGNTSASSGAMVDDFRFRFSSKYLDAETGFYYYGYRFYDPEMGRWLSRDPIGELGGNNLYDMGFNSVVNYVDVRGLGTFEIRTAPVAVYGQQKDDYEYNTNLLEDGKVPGFEVRYIPSSGECPDGSRLQMSKALNWQYFWAGNGPYFDNVKNYAKKNKESPHGILPPPSTEPDFQPYGVTSEADGPRNPWYFIDVVMFEVCVICCTEGEYKIVGCFTFKFNDKTRKVKVKQGKKWNGVKDSWYQVTPESESGQLWKDADSRWRKDGGSLVK